MSVLWESRYTTIVPLRQIGSRIALHLRFFPGGSHARGRAEVGTSYSAACGSRQDQVLCRAVDETIYLSVGSRPLHVVGDSSINPRLHSSSLTAPMRVASAVAAAWLSRRSVVRFCVISVRNSGRFPIPRPSV